MKKINTYSKTIQKGYTPEVLAAYAKDDPEALRLVGPRNAKQTASSGPVTPAPGGGQWKVEAE
jgi:hypothetical protein